MVKLLVSRPDHDLATAYSAAYGQLLIAYAQQNGYEVKDLYNDAPNASARLVDFEAAMQSFNPEMVVMFGHGNSTTITGQDMETLVKVGVNDDIMSGKTTYLASCSTAIQLGPAMVSKTCQAYFGYQADFTYIYNPNYETKPLDDPWAKAFFDCMLSTGYAILLNKTPKEVYELTLQRYDYWWNYWLQQNDPIADDILTWLNWDRSAFTAITPDGIYAKEKVGISASALLPLGLGAAALLFLLSSD